MRKTSVQIAALPTSLAISDQCLIQGFHRTYERTYGLQF